MSLDPEPILQLLNKQFGNETVSVSPVISHPPCLVITKEKLVEVCIFLRDHPDTDFDMLSSVTGIDNAPDSQTMEVIYHLSSLPNETQLALNVHLERPALPDLPEVDSLCKVWPSANWLERETYDLLGIRFIDHPDLRRILLPGDWKGYPLRKDYKTDEYYHHVKIDY